ncbi:CDP-alcohol phosphatidyltransferase family protein [Nocardioides cavernaquae]|uniref:CDP-alcohol phosphatidyltransferase family protein n=1 Tax=Nocardioides cavernaquae TaxID=2321396 RepID=A0A3A5H8J1_9ACTN|nr:CDP-alcohol phosphatidyltransferase family protein [Nocardioides cavernaquae]RJS46969.1 CDP-alcohol phosphatidyltransferase family protein [Nocardioides cavernaquae]
MTTIEHLQPAPATALQNPGPFLTVPNAVTLVRTLAAVVLGMIALVRQDATLLVAAYSCYWLGDMLDGWSARRLGQETRAGAVFDIICDRACTAIACAALVVIVPDALVAAVAFLLSFMVLDTMLSLAFLCWPVLSPNYFHRVDRRVWLLNWSPAAKALNTAGVVGALALGQYAVALAVTLVVGGIKVWSLVRVARLLDAPARLS